MNKNSKQIILSLAAILVGFGLVFVLSNFLEKSRPVLAESVEDEDLSLKGGRLKGFALGSEGLLADCYWIQSLQYIGNKILNSKQNINIENLQPLNPRLLYPMLDTATDLDPQFLVAYSYGAVVLPAIDQQQAIRITEKGIRANPNEWRLYQHLGFIYWKLGEYEKAADIYAQGSKIEGAPDFLGLMAAQMQTQGGSRATARAMYRQMYESAQDSQTKEAASIRLLQLDSLDERDAIRQALQSFPKTGSSCPKNWREVFPLLRNQKNLRFDPATFAPVDPTGAAYLLQSNGACDVVIDPQKSKIPVS